MSANPFKQHVKKFDYDDAIVKKSRDLQNTVQVPYYATRVPTGYPDPEFDPQMEFLILNSSYVRDPETSFCVRVSGDSMIDAGISTRTLLVVDREVQPTNGKIVLARLNGEITLKRFFQVDGQVLLVPENPNYPSIEVKPEDTFTIIGVVMQILQRK